MRGVVASSLGSSIARMRGSRIFIRLGGNRAAFCSFTGVGPRRVKLGTDASIKRPLPTSFSRGACQVSKGDGLFRRLVAPRFRGNCPVDGGRVIGVASGRRIVGLRIVHVITGMRLSVSGTASRSVILGDVALSSIALGNGQGVGLLPGISSTGGLGNIGLTSNITGKAVALATSRGGGNVAVKRKTARATCFCVGRDLMSGERSNNGQCFVLSLAAMSTAANAADGRHCTVLS